MPELQLNFNDTSEKRNAALETAKAQSKTKLILFGGGMLEVATIAVILIYRNDKKKKQIPLQGVKTVKKKKARKTSRKK